MVTNWLEVRPHIAAALKNGTPVVALESTVISHGLPAPQNLETATALEEIVRARGGVPATVAVRDGRAVAGISPDEIATLARRDGVIKASRRNLASVLAASHDGVMGSTTVAATMMVAQAAGIEIFATGGIGGVHRGDAMDISADLIELGQTPVTVVCSGNKIVLDVARSYEFLETQGVPVIGYQTDRLPAFYVRDGGIQLDQTVDSAAAAATLIRRQRSLPGAGGMVIVNPPPVDAALDGVELESLIERALQDCADQNVAGKDVTPFLLDRLATASGGRTIATNIALLKSNAGVAADIAIACANLQ